MKDIPREELQSKVRKGDDWDRVKGLLNTARDEINEWKEISDMFEMSPQDIRTALMEQKFEEIAGDTRDVADVRREYEANRKSLSDKMYERFVDKYPDIKTDDLPEDVVDAVKAGRDLVEVYDEYARGQELSGKSNEISELKAQIAALEAKVGVKTQNTKTKKKGVIKKTSGSDTNTNTDDFLLGLTGDY